MLETIIKSFLISFTISFNLFAFIKIQSLFIEIKREFSSIENENESFELEIDITITEEVINNKNLENEEND